MNHFRVLNTIVVILMVMTAFKTINCEIDSTETTQELGCPCVLPDICPRILGTQESDDELLKTVGECNEIGYVRCCGASSTFIVNAVPHTEDNKSIATQSPPITTTTEQMMVSTVPTSMPTDEVVTVTPQPSMNVYKMNQRQIRLLNNVSLIYPSEMSGIPKSRPVNMSDNEPMPMKMMDEESGQEMFVVFPKADEETTTELITTSTLSIAVDTTSSVNQSAQVEQTNPTTTTTTKPKLKKRKYLKKVKKPKKNIKLKPVVTTTPNGEQLPIATTLRPIANDEDTKLKISELYKRRRVPIRNYLSTLTTTPSPLYGDPDIRTERSKVESRDDEYSTNRAARKMSIIFDPARRMNFLRRNPNSETDAQPTTLRPDPAVSQRGRTPNVDLDHKQLISGVHTMLSGPTVVAETPREIMDPAVSSRVARIEDQLKNKFTDMVNRMIGVKAELTREPPTELLRGDSNRPYRGRIRFMVPNSWHDQQQYGDYEQKPYNQNRPSIIRRGQYGRITTEATTTTTTSERPVNRARRPILRRGRLMTTTIPTTTTKTTTTTTTTTQQPTTTTTLIPETTTEIITTTESPIPVTEVIPDIPIDAVEPPSVFPVEQSPYLSPSIGEFRPSPLWTLHTEEIVPKHTANADYIIAEPQFSRQSRSSFNNPPKTYGGFVPVVHNGNPLSVIGPVPKGFRVIKDDVSNVGLELPRELQYSSSTNF